MSLISHVCLKISSNIKKERQSLTLHLIFFLVHYHPFQMKELLVALENAQLHFSLLGLKCDFHTNAF